MIDFIIAHQALIREVINGVSMVLFLTLSVLTLVFMWDTFVSISSKRDWRHAPGMPTACALWWVFVAETYRTGAVWVLYNVGKDQSDTGAFFESTSVATSYGYLIAGCMLIGGLLRSIYIFTPPQWKKRVWVCASVWAVVFCFIPTIINVVKRNFFNGI